MFPDRDRSLAVSLVFDRRRRIGKSVVMIVDAHVLAENRTVTDSDALARMQSQKSLKNTSSPRTTRPPFSIVS